MQHLRDRARLLALLGTLAAALTAATVLAGAGQRASAAGGRPDPTVPAGAQALPDRQFVKNARTTCDFYVDPLGSDASSGSQSAPWRSFGKAVRTLAAGQVACVNSGTYNEPGASAVNSGTETAPIVVQRTPGSPSRPVIRLTQATPVLRIEKGYWIVDGLEFDLNRQVTTGMVFGAAGHHVALRNSYVHDDARGAAVYVSGDDVSIESSEIANNFHYAGEDSHGVLVVAGAARVLVKGNRIHDNGGDGVQCEYLGGPTDAQTPVDVTIEDNRFWTSPENENRVEQGVDIKTCRNVSIRGGVPPDANDPNAANQKFFGFKNTSGASGGAGAMVIHLGARNVLVENNRIWDSCHGIGIGRSDTTYGIVENVVVRRNVLFNIKATTGQCRGYGIEIQRVNRADIYHNTFDGIAAWAFRIGVNNATGSKDVDVDFWANVIRNAGRFIDVRASVLDGFASDDNLFWSSDGNQTRFYVDGSVLTLAGWRARQNGTSVLLADPTSAVADPAFVPGAGTTDDYLTQPSSPARDSARDNTNSAASGGGPDRGFRETYDAAAGGPCQTGTVDAAWRSEAFAAQSGTFTALVDVVPLGKPIGAGIGLGDVPAAAWTDMAAIIRFDDVSGTIDARSGGAYTAATPIPYEANVRYRLRFVVDVAAKRYSAYVTPPGEGERTIGTNLAFRTEQQSLSNFDTKNVPTAIGALLACNFRVTQTGPPPPPGSSPIVAAAGDIACDPASSSFNGGNGTSSACRQRYTSDLLTGGRYTAVLTLGDNQYENGTLSQFRASYDPSWGRVRSITRPVPGNHEYHVAGAAGYFDYFGTAAGERGKGWYSFDVGSWHVVALNSNCSAVGGCGAGSAQHTWLRNDLAANPRSCTLAYFHHPRFSSGSHGNNTSVQPLWQALYDANADLVLSGHDHTYERFAPQTPAGASDPARGIREFVVGTGGKSLYGFGATQPNSEARSSTSFGVLELTLRDTGYDWRFVPAAGSSFTDSGSGTCH